MKNENGIVSFDGGYKLTNGNAQSVETYGTLDDAKEADKADFEAWETSSDAAEAEENSPVEWE